MFIIEHGWQPAQLSDRTTSDDRHEGGPGAVSLPLPRSDDLGRPDEAPEDGALYVAAWRGGHGQGTQLCPHLTHSYSDCNGIDEYLRLPTNA